MPKSPTTRRRGSQQSLVPGTKRERTRAALIGAAARLIAERGYHNTSLEDVAALAGMSRGAIYGNFKDRDELFMAVLQARWTPIIPEFKVGASFKDQMRILARAVIAAAPARQAMAIRALEFQLYALTNPKMRAELQKASAEGYRLAEAWLLKFIPAEQLPMPAPRFVRVLNALTDGLLFERFQAPNEITEEIIISAFEALASE